MNLSRNSMLYKSLMFWGVTYRFRHGNMDSCQFNRMIAWLYTKVLFFGFIGGGLLLSLLTALATWVGILDYSLMHEGELLHGLFGVGTTTGVVVGMLLIGIGLILLREYINAKWDERKRELEEAGINPFTKPKEPGFLSQWWKSIKDRYCTFVNIVE